MLNLLHQQKRINGDGSGMRRRQDLTANEVKMQSGWEQQGRRGWTGMAEINQSSSHQASGQMLWRSLYVNQRRSISTLSEFCFYPLAIIAFDCPARFTDDRGRSNPCSHSHRGAVMADLDRTGPVLLCKTLTVTSSDNICLKTRILWVLW